MSSRAERLEKKRVSRRGMLEHLCTAFALTGPSMNGITLALMVCGLVSRAISRSAPNASRGSRWLLVVSIAGGIGCREEQDRAAASVAADADSKTMVGYDLRRLRPRDTDLSVMFDEQFQQARKEGKAVAVLFSAGWCEPCRTLELELGNFQPEESIGRMRILELKEEDWEGATRMNEFNELRRRWHPILNSYPLFYVLDDQGAGIEEMRDAIDRLKAQGVEPTIANWFRSVRQGGVAAAG